QDLKYRGEPTYLEIGDENTFREFVTAHRSTTSEGKTRVGNNGNFLAYSHIGHDCTVGDHVIFLQQRNISRPLTGRQSCRYGRTYGRTSVLPDRPFCDHWRLLENYSGRSPIHDRRR